ncbi:MAG: 30S ribosomal protein S11, partial [Firmicutes bacterium]|nr:30S ribosomal protein S11 [Bacillota bacterium]
MCASYRTLSHRKRKTGTVKKKVVKVGALGMAFVHSTFNNVIITITNEVGEVISWSSAGK